jgi:hypothetical protein
MSGFGLYIDARGACLLWVSRPRLDGASQIQIPCGDRISGISSQLDLSIACGMSAFDMVM